MKRHLNTLFITIEGTYLHCDGSAVEIRQQGEVKLRVPLHNLESVCCFGWDIVVSAALLAACTEHHIGISFHNPHGKFLAAAQGYLSGNILLRREQYRQADLPVSSLSIARFIVAAKINNCRNVLLRGARDHGDKFPTSGAALLGAADALSPRIETALRATSMESIRGIEGDAATYYFGVFSLLLVNHDSAISMEGRSRRPPLDPVNALLSFLYTLLMHDCRSALEACGLDSQCGFLHRDRPGRPSLALDLMEEFRPYLADRTALTLLNRRQLTASDFEKQETGAVYLREKSRKTVLAAWQERKQDEITHPFLDEKTTVGLLPHLQARLLARYLRGDLDAYPAFLTKP